MVLDGIYIPPRPALMAEAQQTLRKLLHQAQAAAGNRPWLAMGDYNTPPEDLQGLFSQRGGTLLNKHTKWQSKRYIDRKWLNTSLQMQWEEDTHRCTLQRTHLWKPPPGSNPAEWKAHVSNTCTKMGTTTAAIPAVAAARRQKPRQTLLRQRCNWVPSGKIPSNKLRKQTCLKSLGGSSPRGSRKQPSSQTEVEEKQRAHAEAAAQTKQAGRFSRSCLL